MKNSIALLLVLFSFISCENDKLTVQEDENLVAEVESLQDDILKEVEEPIAQPFSYLNDYIKITTREELAEEFGEMSLTDNVVWQAEGTVKRSTTLLINPKTWHHITYYWDDETEKTASVEASYYMWSSDGDIKGSQKLEAKNGLYTGMPLAELVEWNGADIRFSGFGWDYGGSIFNSTDDKLAASNVLITLIDLQENYKGYKFMLGDVELSSAENRMKGAPVVLETLSLVANNEE